VAVAMAFTVVVDIKFYQVIYTYKKAQHSIQWYRQHVPNGFEQIRCHRKGLGDYITGK
jgi:hypothetical protein